MFFLNCLCYNTQCRGALLFLRMANCGDTWEGNCCPRDTEDFEVQHKCTAV